MSPISAAPFAGADAAWPLRSIVHAKQLRSKTRCGMGDGDTRKIFRRDREPDEAGFRSYGAGELPHENHRRSSFPWPCFNLQYSPIANQSGAIACNSFSEYDSLSRDYDICNEHGFAGV
jgi:hypothetical protein